MQALSRSATHRRSTTDECHSLVPLLRRCCPRQAVAAAEARSYEERESPSLSPSFSLTRRSEKRATREREKKMKKILQKLSVLDGVYFFFLLAAFLLLGNSSNDEPLHLTPRRVDVVIFGLLLLRLRGGVELPSEERAREGWNAEDDQNLVVVSSAASGSDASALLPKLLLPSRRRRRCSRQRRRRRLSLFLPRRLRGRLGHEADLVPPVLDRRHGRLRRRRGQSRRRDLVGAGCRGRDLDLVVGVPGGVPRGVPRLREAGGDEADGRCC